MPVKREKTVRPENGAPLEETEYQQASILGIKVCNASKKEAIALIEQLIQQGTGTAQAIYIVNAHTLNLAAEDPRYHQTLNSAYRVLGDGTGVRWAARQRGVLMRDNLVGTDLIPELFESTSGRGYRYFLLGGDPQTIARAADACSKRYPGWDLAGFHHGYLNKDKTTEAIKVINEAKPDVLLVGMGNPRQEQWICAHQHELKVPVAIGVGGLFDHWAGNLTRAPLWVRQKGFEWLQLLSQQPHKWRRYLIGNPKFLIRILLTLGTDRS
jgi:N-acetylglucosaminyldiphosphoundecaprenol N-acetyl-beta-D-mannosaminyltransferase